MGLPEGDPLGQMQGLQALGQGGEIAAREIPRHTERRQRQDPQHRQQNAERMLLLWGGVLALRTARRIALFDLSGGKEACPLGLRQTGSGAAHHIQQPETGVICGGDGAEPAAFFGAEHQHMVAFPLGTGHGQLCSHDAAGRLRPGEGQTDRVGFVPSPAELGRTRFSIWGPTLASA